MPWHEIFGFPLRAVVLPFLTFAVVVFFGLEYTNSLCSSSLGWRVRPGIFVVIFVRNILGRCLP